MEEKLVLVQNALAIEAEGSQRWFALSFLQDGIQNIISRRINDLSYTHGGTILDVVNAQERLNQDYERLFPSE